MTKIQLSWAVSNILLQLHDCHQCFPGTAQKSQHPTNGISFKGQMTARTDGHHLMHSPLNVVIICLSGFAD